MFAHRYRYRGKHRTSPVPRPTPPNKAGRSKSAYVLAA